MKTTKQVLSEIQKQKENEEIKQGNRRGFWLVRAFDKERFFISEQVSELNLEKTCNKVLSEKTGFDYWIDYCYGLDVTGRIAWSNVDQTDRFI